MTLALWGKIHSRAKGIMPSWPNGPQREEWTMRLESETPTQAIRRELRELGTAFRGRHEWVEKNQDAIGLLIFLASIAGSVLTGLAYAKGIVPAWVCVPAVAFFLSLLHELEHDLIHNLYFANNKVIFNGMMAGVWLMRPSSINPWLRRKMHLHHHKVSGTESDIEERAITNGEPWDLRRFVMTGDGILSVLLRPRQMASTSRAFVLAQRLPTSQQRRRLALQNVLAYFPLGIVHYALLHAFLIVTLASAIAKASGNALVLSPAMAALMTNLHVVAVAFLLPNALRTFCLHFVSSNVHYYGDVERGNIVQQTQVWTAWWMMPFQAFCFNFGGTHAIHHFVVNDPFYVRQAIAKGAHDVLRRHGVRFNDFGTFARGNRWSLVSRPIADEPSSEPSGKDAIALAA